MYRLDTAVITKCDGSDAGGISGCRAEKLPECSYRGVIWPCLRRWLRWSRRCCLSRIPLPSRALPEPRHEAVSQHPPETLISVLEPAPQPGPPPSERAGAEPCLIFLWRQEQCCSGVRLLDASTAQQLLISGTSFLSSSVVFCRGAVFCRWIAFPGMPTGCPASLLMLCHPQ